MTKKKTGNDGKSSSQTHYVKRGGKSGPPVTNPPAPKK